MRHFALRTAAAGLVFIAALNGARADVIIQTAGIGFGGTNFGTDHFAFEPFDPYLGALNEAVFSTTLTLAYEVQTTPLLDQYGFPVLTMVTGNVHLDMDGVTWPFDFEADCQTFTPISSGQSFVFNMNVNLTWRSDFASDQVGLTIGHGDPGDCNPWLLNPVHRSDYFANPVNQYTGLLTAFHSIWEVEVEHGIALPTSGGGGIAMLTYYYTPRVAGPVTNPSPVPEPAHGALFGLGLACLALCRRKRGNGVKALPAKQSRVA